MTRDQFIQVLEEKRYSYQEEGERIIVDHKGYVSFRSLKSLPAGIEFNNEGYVWLNNLTSLPAGVEFKNGGSVWLRSLTSLPSGVQFKNEEYVSLPSLTSLPIKDLDYTFQNSGGIYIEGLNIEEVEFPESRWVPVKPRRVKTFEGFTSDI
jgi:hypothetical protein